MKKRNMSLILVLALILCLIPATAFADTEKTLSGGISTATVISENTIIDENTWIASSPGKITVESGATLTIKEGVWLNLATASATGVVLTVKEGGKLVVNGKLFSKSACADMMQLGTMTISGTNAQIIMNYGSKSTETPQTIYIGTGGLITLDSKAVITSTPLTAGTYADGYKYVISGGTATTHGFPNSGKDELVVADGATLDATNGLTLNSADGASTKQLTVQDGGKLVTTSAADKTSLASIFGATTAVTQAKITSGTYTEDPTSYVATGYKVVKNTEGTEWTVKPAGILSKIAVVVKEPVVGETPASTYTSTVTTAKSATAIDEVVWYKVAKADYVDLDDPKAGDVWTQVGEGEKFQKDYYYAFMTAFVITDGYEVSDNLAVTVNAKKADLVYDSTDGDADADVVTIAKVFGPLAEKSPVTGDNNELGLFAVAGLISALGVALMLRRKHSM